MAGANYGRAYLWALAQATDRFHLAGLLSSASARSVRVAEEFNIPLFHSVEDAPQDIELACAALGSRGFPIVLDLIRRRIPVLCEHPLTPNMLDSALDQAKAYSTPLHVNAHFPMLPSARDFAHGLSRPGERPAFLDVLATERSLYAALAILFMALGSAEPFEVRSARPGKPFVNVEAMFGGIPLLLRLQCEPLEEPAQNGHGVRHALCASKAIPDGDAAYLVDYRITAGLRAGLLTLLSMGGPVIWTANYALPATGVAVQSSQVSPDQLRMQRRDANLEAIENILNHRTSADQHPDHLRALSTAWQTVADAIQP